MKILLFVLSLFVSFWASSQTREYSNIKSFSKNIIRPIIQNKAINGYISLYLVEKKDKTNNNYMLVIMDANLTVSHEIPIIKPKTFYLLEVQFNGTHFGALFYDSNTGKFSLDIFDQKGLSSGTYESDILDETWFIGHWDLSAANDGYTANLLSSAESEGFILSYNSVEKETKLKKFTMDLVSNSAKNTWTSRPVSTPGAKKTFENGLVVYSNSKISVVEVTSMANALGKDTKSEVVFIDNESGKVTGTYKYDNTTKYHSETGQYYNNIKDEILLFGEYYESKGGTPDFKQKLGFYIKVVNRSGQELSEKYLTWANDINGKILPNKQGKVENNVSIMIHSIIRTNDGKFYAIGEQFNKEVNKGAIAGKAAGGILTAVTGGVVGGSNRSSVMKIVLYNMIVFEMTPSFGIDKVHVVEKKKKNVDLPYGFGMVGEEKIGYYLKMVGGFDYQWSAIDEEAKFFSSAYLSYDKKAEKGEKYSVGVLMKGIEGDVMNTLLPIDSKEQYFFSVPSKPGYLLIAQYFKKEKKAVLTLTKIDL